MEEKGIFSSYLEVSSFKPGFSIKLFIILGFVVLVGSISTQTQEVFAEQLGRPDQTISNIDWTAVGATSEHQAVNEATPNGDTDYILGSSKTAHIEFGLPDFSDPEVSYGHVLHFTAQATGSGGAEKARIYLFQGAVEIARGTFTITRDSYNTYSYTLSNSKADSITDYTDLRIQLEIRKLANSGEEIRITQTEFEVPEGESVSTSEIIETNTQGSKAYETPTIGKNLSGNIQMVENGICIDIDCWTVTQGYHQEFELYEMLTNTHTISLTIFCNEGVEKCNYASVGIMPLTDDFNSAVWRIAIQKDHKGEWTLLVNDPQGYLGEITYTTQIIDEKFLGVSFTINFKNKSTDQMKLGVQLRDVNHGVRNFFFNEGVKFIDVYAYPNVNTTYEPPLKIEPLCLNEDPSNRYSCAFAKIKELEKQRAEESLIEIMKKNPLIRHGYK